MSRISDICKYYNVGKDTIVNLLRYFPEYGRVIDSLSYKLNDTQIVIIDNFFKRDRRILEAASKILFRRKKGTNINYSSKILFQKELTDTPKNASIIKEKLNEILTEEKKDNILKELQNNKVENNRINPVKKRKLGKKNKKLNKKNVIIGGHFINKNAVKNIKEEKTTNLSTRKTSVHSKKLLIDYIEFKNGYYLVWDCDYQKEETSITPLKIKDNYSSAYFNFMKKYFSKNFPLNVDVEFFDDHVSRITPEIKLKDFVRLLQSNLSEKGKWWEDINIFNLRRRRMISSRCSQAQIREDISFRTPYLDYLCGLLANSPIVKAYEVIGSNEEDACIFTIESEKRKYIIFENLSVSARATEVFETEELEKTISYVFEYFASDLIERKREIIRRKAINEDKFACIKYYSIDHDNFVLWKDKINSILQKSVNKGKIAFKHGIRIPSKETMRIVHSKNYAINDLHNKLVLKLYDDLVTSYGAENVGTEISIGNRRIDVVVKNNSIYDLFEIKTYETEEKCIREALGQILEYAYYDNSDPIGKLVIVGPAPLSKEAEMYLKKLRETYNINIHYMNIQI